MLMKKMREKLQTFFTFFQIIFRQNKKACKLQTLALEKK
jgi:hypothetical protein